ncbi:MAG: hypothetical protein QOH84_2179 [Kribbellaceae bacterium]|nr:hypothetical protein [Kribbellaceae bacterium]
MLNTILSGPGERRIYSFDAHWRPGQELAAMESGSGDQYSIVFSSAGVIAQGFDHESPISHWNNPARKTWPGLFIGLPAELAPALDEPAFRDDDGSLAVTVCFWRTPADDRWHCGPVDAGVKDGADWMFELLAPGRPEAYQRFAKYFYGSAPEIELVRHVYESRPLTEEIVAALNPELVLAELEREISAIGYPHPSPNA